MDLALSAKSGCTITVVDFAQGHRLMHDYFNMRRVILKERMKWPLHVSVTDGFEYDQYDHILAKYILLHKDGTLLGGGRLMHTDTQLDVLGTKTYSYMIRDAVEGQLEGLPSDLTFEAPPRDPDIWEFTRFVADVPFAGEDIMHGVNEFLKRVNGKSCYFLGPPAFMRMAKSFGYEPVKRGPISGNKDGRFMVFSCDTLYRDNFDFVSLVDADQRRLN